MFGSDLGYDGVSMHAVRDVFHVGSSIACPKLSSFFSFPYLFL
jgi:hypothetical protein